MYNEKSRGNLKPFSSENQPEKNGRPKGSSSLTNEIRKVLDGIDESSKKPIRELLAIAATKQAMKGNAAYFKEIIERCDGKVPDKPEHFGPDGEPLDHTIKIVFVDPKDGKPDI
jgi:hypothetical protein